MENPTSNELAANQNWLRTSWSYDLNHRPSSPKIIAVYVKAEVNLYAKSGGDSPVCSYHKYKQPH